jgi:glycolate oxidase
MELTNEEYSALEDVVGPEYITRDPAIRDTYNQVWMNKLIFDQKWSNRPAVIVLPGNTQDVQGIVRVCNRYRIPFKPIGTGWECVMALVTERGILLDLRRMNRILEIDTKNMHALVEPYVSAHLLQREAAKYGLRVGQPGAGPSASVVAFTACHMGAGPTSVCTGGQGRNVLGVEWVLPTGDILRPGTAEAGNGWFSADGPGLSLRGILRGRAGANGGHGIITKACTKLYPWYGPPEYELIGAPAGQKHLEKVPDGYKVLVMAFPTINDRDNAHREIWQAEIATYVSGLGMLPGGEGNDEGWENYQKMSAEEHDLSNKTVQVIVGGNSAREIEYRWECALAISKKWNGEFKPELNAPEMLVGLFGVAIWGFGMPTILRQCGDMFIPPTIDGSWESAAQLDKIVQDFTQPYRDRGEVIVTPCGGPLFGSEDLSQGTHYESGFTFDPWDPVSLKAAREYGQEVDNPDGRFSRFGVPHIGGGLSWEPTQHIHQKFGPLYDNYDVWLRKIKAALDPNNVADWGAYIPPEYSK